MASYTTLIILVVWLCTAHGSPINPLPDTYDINENMIPDEEHGDIEGLLPPLETSVDYYAQQQEPEVRNSSYIMDTVNKVLRLASSDAKDGEATQAEKDFMKQMAQGFASLFGAAGNQNDDETNRRPMFRMSADGLSLEFAGNDEKDEVNVREEAPSTEAGDEVDPTTTEEVVDTTTTTEESTESEPRSDDSGSDFLRALWDTVRTSLDYAARLIFGGEDSKVTTVTTPATATSGGLVALEEPLTRHQLPAQEFEKGGRDTDALLYGRGIA